MFWVLVGAAVFVFALTATWFYHMGRADGCNEAELQQREAAQEKNNEYFMEMRIKRISRQVFEELIDPWYKRQKRRDEYEKTFLPAKMYFDEQGIWPHEKKKWKKK